MSMLGSTNISRDLRVLEETMGVFEKANRGLLVIQV